MKKIFYLSALSVLLVSAAMADGVCPSPTPGTATIASYFGITSCHIGNLDFSNFFFGSTAGGGANPLSGSQIGVTTVTGTTGSGIPFEGFAFAPISGLSVSSPGTIDVQVGFTVTPVAGSGVTLEDLGISFNGSATGSGTTNFTESWCFANESVPTCIASGTAGDFKVTNPPSHLTDDVVFPSPVSAITVLKDVLVNTGSSAGTAAISAFGNTFSYTPVPEPVYTTMLAAGLLGLGWMRKRRQSRG